MPWLELTLRCHEQDQPRYDRALDDVGALAVTLLDADVDTPNEHAILEPGVGETPLWGEIALSALFDADTDALVLLAALEAFDADLDWSNASFRIAPSAASASVGSPSARTRPAAATTAASSSGSNASDWMAL